jgi:putative ABC transport system substrate-binding protein
VKKSIIIFVILFIGVASSIFVYMCTKQKAKSGTTRIAILTPLTHSALEEIEQGFRETLEKAHPHAYSFTTYNANGNKTVLRGQAEEIVGDSYDLIFSLGAYCTTTIAELLHKKEATVPHVFGGVDGRNFAQSVKDINDSSTGVYMEPDYEGEMDILHELKPDIKNILLVYDPTQGTGLEKYKNEITQYIQKFGSTLQSVEVYHIQEIQQKVSALLPHVDVVLVLMDNTVVSGIDALITLCNRYGVTLLVSDLNSGRKGAGLAYGITEYETGATAAYKALAILINGKKPREIPLDAIKNFRVEINKNTMREQHLDLSDQLIKQYENKGAGHV